MRSQCKNIMVSILLILMLTSMTKVDCLYAQTKEEGCAISIAVDVSGSMESTDTDGITIQLIKLFIDSCTEGDYLSVVAYNDSIVYDSGMVDMGNPEQKNILKRELDSIEFRGNTDNGLGMLAATNEIVNLQKDYGNAFVLVITDGDTYLVGSDTGRNVEDSNEDMNSCARLAVENDITLHIIEYTSTFMQDTNIMSVVTATTGGGTNITDNSRQFAQIMLSTFFSEYRNVKTDFVVEETKDILNRKKYNVSVGENQTGYAVIFSSKPMDDFEILSSSEKIDYCRGENYAVMHLAQGFEGELPIIYTVGEKGWCVSGQAITENNTLPVIEETSEPTKARTEEITETQFQEQIPTKAEDDRESGDLNGLYVAFLIAFIVVVTLLICGLIVKRILLSNSGRQAALKGILEARFLNLKSKNEVNNVSWNLGDYSPAGVSLLELFKGSSIREDLADLDKLVFYPSDKEYELTLVHAMTGGVFLNETNVHANAPVKVKIGDTIYISFAENASEMAIYYKKEP